MTRSSTHIVYSILLALFLSLSTRPLTAAELKLPRATLPSVAGGTASLTELAGKQATILVFLSPECPISNGYLPALNRLATAHKAGEVAVIGLHPNAGHAIKELAAHRKAYEIAFPVLKDAGGEVAAAVGVNTCPTVCVFDSQGRLRYRGRIDDRHVRRGTAAGEVRSKDLEDALADLLAGRAVKTPETQPVGCPIPSRAVQAHDAAAARVTYHRDISRILQQNCQGCHRPEGVGPFSLLTYEQAVSWADDLKQFTKDGSMPPWKPVAGHGEFNNERRMSAADIAAIGRWVDAGCPAGDPKDAPPPRKFSGGWQLGTPDQILTPSEPFRLAADGRDVYQCFVLPDEFDSDLYVTAAEVLPGNARVVHHVLVFIDTSGRSEELDQKDPAPGYATDQGFPGFLPAGGLGGWAPGNTADFLPAGMAKVLPKGSRVVIQVHYHPTGKEEVDQTRIGLYFSKVPVDRAVRSLPVMPAGGRYSGMKLPAGDSNAEVRATHITQRDLLAVAVTPHMHLLGKDMKITATLPDGTVKPLVYVTNWDFNWQESYQFRHPVDLPKGTRIDLVAHFDNSAANPRNPASPPRDVAWGEQTNDEMCIGFIEVALREKAASPSELQAPIPGDALFQGVRSRLTDRIGKGVTGLIGKIPSQGLLGEKKKEK